MVEAVTLVAVALLVLGVVGSVVPLVPGALLSLAGVYLHWWHTGYTEPGVGLLVAFTLVGLLVLAVDLLAGAVAAGVGGASRVTVLVAAVVGVVLTVVAGPVGLLVGVVGTVFAVEFRRNRDARESLRTAAYATAGMLGSVVVQVVLTGAMLVAFVLVVL